MRTSSLLFLGSSLAILLAVPACSSSSDSDSPTPGSDAGVPDAQAEASPEASPEDGSPDVVQEAGSESGTEAGTEAGTDATTEASSDDVDGDGIPNAEDACPDEPEDADGWEDEDGCPDPEGNDGPLPALIDQAGVVYAIHYHSGELFWYRTDGATPRFEGSMDMGSVSHDAVLDPVHDTLYVAHDAAKQVEIYELGRPADASASTPQPALAATLDFADSPYFVRVNPYRQRLYVLQSLPGSGGPVTEAALFIYDVSDPSSPAMMAGSPHTIPSTASWDIDPVRDLLFLYHGPTETVHGFDLHGDTVTALPGDPIVLTDLYPQENTWGFQARNLTLDPFSNRIYAARPQGNLSELIVLSYPADIPKGGATYSQFAGMDNLTMMADPFDVDLPLDQRPHILDAFTPVPDPVAGALFLVASSWNGTASTSLVASMPTSLDALDEGCGAFEGFGCWYRSYASGSPGSHLMTDGAACADLTHQVFVGSTYDLYDETNPGMLHFFQYDDARSLDVWLPDGGGNVMAGAMPISVLCH